MPHVFEMARTGRAKCRGCGQPIPAGSQRFGERVPNPFADEGAETTHWFHVPCGAFLRPESFLAGLAETTDAVPDRETLVQQAELGTRFRRLPRATRVERASTGRATCRACREPIEKGAWRIALLYYEDGRFSPSGFIHVTCAPAYLETTEVLPRLRHFSPDLGDAEAAEIESLLRSGSPTGVIDAS